jgi:uncharacterized protein (TIGR02217 family)
MSNEIYPSLPGLKWDQKKTPIFSTRIQKSVSGRELRSPFYVYPLYQYELSYDLLRDSNAHNELKTLMGFYLARQGAYDSFLYNDASDNNTSSQAIGTGDGNTVAFQMVRTYGGNNGNFTEPIYNIPANSNNTPINVYLNGNVQSANNYTVNGNNSGILTFNSAPANGANITADFYFYRRVRFEEYEEGDDAFNQFMQNLWNLNKVSLITVR